MVVSVCLAINLMIYYVILKNRQNAKKRIVPTKTLKKTHTVNLYPNNHSAEPINILTHRMKKIDYFASKNNTYHFGQIETEPYNLPV